MEGTLPNWKEQSQYQYHLTKAHSIAPEKIGNQNLPVQFRFHLSPVTLHQRESTPPDTQGTFPPLIRQVSRPESKPIFHSPFTLFDHWLLLIWHCPHSSNDFHLIELTSHLSERIKDLKLSPDKAYGPWVALPMEHSPAPTISNSVSFVLVGTGVRVPLRAWRIIHTLWSQVFMNYYLFMSASSSP